MHSFILRWFVVISLLVGSLGAGEQKTPVQKDPAQAGAGDPTEPGTAGSTSTASASGALEGAVPRLVRFSGILKNSTGLPRNGQIALTFAIYGGEHDAAPLWSETQNAEIDRNGRYTVLLGSASPNGIPRELFVTGEQRWLGMRAETPGEEEQPRILLISVPYALKAADADTLGGKPLSALMLAEPPARGSDPQTGPGASEPMAGPGAPAVGTANYIAKFDAGGNTVNSLMYEDASGKIGIATASPRAALDVHGIIKGGTNSSSVGLDLAGWGAAAAADFLYPNGGRFRNTEYTIKGTNDLFSQAIPLNGYGYLLLEAWGSAGMVVGTGGNTAPVIFQVNRVEKARIDGNGNLGIGTTAPGSRLVAQGATADGNASAFRATDSTGSSLLFVSNDGKVGIGTNAPAEKLSLAGNLKIAGSGNGIIFPDGSAQTSATAVFNVLELTRAVPVTVNNYVEIGNYNIDNGAHNVRLSITVSAGYFSVAKTYAITARKNQSQGAWQKVLPVSTSGSYSGNDFDLEINVSQNVAALRLRRASGSTAGNAVIRIERVGISSDTFTPMLGTGTASGTLPIFGGAGTGSGATFPDGSVQTKAAKVASLELSRTVPTPLNGYVEIGTWSIVNGAHNIRLSVTTSDSAFWVAKHFLIPVQHNQTGNVWQRVLPVAQTGDYSGNDFDLEIRVNGSDAYLRLRRTSGTQGGTALVRMEFLGLNTDAFTATSATGTATGQSPVYSSAVVTQVAGRAEVAGNLKITGTGNGIVFPDGTVQTTAWGVLAFGAGRGARPASANAGLPPSTDGLSDTRGDARALAELARQQQAQIDELRAELEALRGELITTTAGQK